MCYPCIAFKCFKEELETVQSQMNTITTLQNLYKKQLAALVLE